MPVVVRDSQNLNDPESMLKSAINYETEIAMTDGTDRYSQKDFH
jgi:hypothetical protein